MINTDKHAGYPPAITKLQSTGELDENYHHRPVQYLNNILEQDHRKRNAEDHCSANGTAQVR
jgi:transposase-like protein